jgi:carbonic anhydrase/acetyltransferase-like protein (isoleucine patch superfamily)
LSISGHAIVETGISVSSASVLLVSLSATGFVVDENTFSVLTHTLLEDVLSVTGPTYMGSGISVTDAIGGNGSISIIGNAEFMSSSSIRDALISSRLSIREETFLTVTSISGPLHSGGLLSSAGFVSLGLSLSAHEGVVIGQEMSVGETVRYGSNVSISGNSQIGGNFSCINQAFLSDDLEVLGFFSVGSSSVIGGSLAVMDGVSIHGSTNMDGAAIGNGAFVFLDSILSVEEYTDLGADARVSGACEALSNMSVSGLACLGSSLSVNAGVSVNEDLFCFGDTFATFAPAVTVKRVPLRRWMSLSYPERLTR